jgi:hypothetical protein
MEFRRLSDDQLVLSAENQFAIERKTSHYILLHLKEIALRRVYAKRGFPNLREMLIKHFRQSETAANQRLKSLELMLDVPAVEERLISGDLNMSTVGKLRLLNRLRIKQWLRRKSNYLSFCLRPPVIQKPMNEEFLNTRLV